MTAFYLDENIAAALASQLRQRGHSVSTTADERRLGASDAHQLLYAAQRNWIFLTHNRYDFYLLHTAWLLWSDAWGVSSQHAGILIIEQTRRFAADDFAQRIELFVSQYQHGLNNALFDWKPARGWTPYRQ